MQTLSGCNYRSSYAYVSVYVFFYILSLSLSLQNIINPYLKEQTTSIRV